MDVVVRPQRRPRNSRQHQEQQQRQQIDSAFHGVYSPAAGKACGRAAGARARRTDAPAPVAQADHAAERHDDAPIQIHGTSGFQ